MMKFLHGMLMEHKKKWKLHKNDMNTAKYAFFHKSGVISFKKSLIWDQSQHSSSERLKATKVWSETSLLVFERKSWNASNANGATLKNDVEAKPVRKKCWNFAVNMQ